MGRASPIVVRRYQRQQMSAPSLTLLIATVAVLVFLA